MIRLLTNVQPTGKNLSKKESIILPFVVLQSSVLRNWQVLVLGGGDPDVVVDRILVAILEGTLLTASAEPD